MKGTRKLVLTVYKSAGARLQWVCPRRARSTEAAAELPALHATHPGLWAARGTHAGGRTRHPQHPHLALFQRRAGSRAPSISALPFAYPPVPGRNKVRAGSLSPPGPVPASTSSRPTAPRAAQGPGRTEERRVGKEGGMTVKHRWWPTHL